MDDSTKSRIQDLINSDSVFLFMKGTPAAPMCGFSAGVVNALNQVQANFSSFNVLSDPSIREGIKEFSNWPTIPQLYIKGEFIGGHDIVVQMLQSGDLKTKIS